jgi:hypothetical protein
MTPTNNRRHDDGLAFWGKIVGIITGLFAILSFATARMIDPYIENKIECKTKYQEILLRTMASEGQKEEADKEYRRWVSNKR